jgi:hypothetical protein
MTADHQWRSQLSGYEGVLVRVLVRAGTTFSGRKCPSRKGLLPFLSIAVSLGKPNFKTAQTNVGCASSDAIPIGHLAIFSQGYRCQKASESNYIQTTVTRQLHAGHVSRLIERIDSIPANDSRSLEATGSLSNADCFEWPATTVSERVIAVGHHASNAKDGRKK